MKRLVYWAGVLLFVSGCGPSLRVPREDTDVNIGYGTVKKSDLTTSVATLDMERDTQTKSYSDMYEYLQGRVPGLQVTPDKRIIIRGIGSINSSTEPLILVDGAEVSDLSTINPHDVKTVDVLKDGSSSIYGVRGANGVILITTKH
ncbi:MAG: TonB-dependent receptor plug domain-containing protein [Bacteroidales bacterium]|jgi:TonB-dependent SusC/RagA subfamily outer membrane receptor|nr:TonB-dependent receptor plug domain-containing protein [Bacteroidales bacterium]